MNREERRRLGVSKGTADRVNQMNSPCTITEAVQIARGVAEDVVLDYQRRTSNLQISLSLQVELLKKVVMDNGLITEEQFKEMYINAVDDYNKMTQPEQHENPSMSSSVEEIVVEEMK